MAKLTEGSRKTNTKTPAGKKRPIAPPPPGTKLTIPAKADQQASDEAKGAIAGLVNDVAKLSARIANGMALLEQLEKDRANLLEVAIPAALEQAGVKEVTLKSGITVEVKDFITGNIMEENRPEAHKWLRANKFGALIKNRIICAFGMGQDKDAKAFAATLKKMKQPFEQTESVHSSTLQAFVREQLAKGTNLPACIGVAKITKAAIKVPKVRD